MPAQGCGEAVLGVHPNSTNAGTEASACPVASDEEINKLVAEYQDKLETWELGPIDLASHVRKVRDWGAELWSRFLPEVAGGKKLGQPDILFCFHWDRPRRLGHYRPGRNALGLRWEISINPRHLSRRSEVEVAETVLHELLHCYEDLTDTAPRSRNNYHSAWFRETAERLGIPSSRYGASLGIVDPSPFMEWARERGLKHEAVPPRPKDPVSAPQAPKRVAWVCDCPPDKAVTVQVARGSELRARCEICGTAFKRRIGQ